MKEKALIILLFCIAIGCTFVSMTPHNTGFLIISVAMVLTFCSLVIAFFISPWYLGSFKESFKKSLKLGFILASSFYILGYFFILIESLIR